MAIFTTNCENRHFSVSKQTVKVQFSQAGLGNSIFCIKCEKAYFNESASRDKGRGSSCRLAPSCDSLVRLIIFRM